MYQPTMHVIHGLQWQGLDIPKETISAALGHRIGSKTTGIYINFDQRKVDVAKTR